MRIRSSLLLFMLVLYSYVETFTTPVDRKGIDFEKKYPDFGKLHEIDANEWDRFIKSSTEYELDVTSHTFKVDGINPMILDLIIPKKNFDNNLLYKDLVKMIGTKNQIFHMTKRTKLNFFGNEHLLQGYAIYYDKT